MTKERRADEALSGEVERLRQQQRAITRVLHAVARSRRTRARLSISTGDGVMVFFNDPKRGVELGLGIGIGIESGYATLGRMGYEGRYDYGAVGPVTNLASRLSTRAAAGQILTGQRLQGAVENPVRATALGELKLKGSAAPSPPTTSTACADQPPAHAGG